VAALSKNELVQSAQMTDLLPPRLGRVCPKGGGGVFAVAQCPTRRFAPPSATPKEARRREHVSLRVLEAFVFGLSSNFNIRENIRELAVLFF
jgi:hypothetical protein